MKQPHWLPAALVLVSLTACGGSQTDEAPDMPPSTSRQGVAQTEPIDEARVVAGQTIYVPAYSSVLTSNRPHHFDLAVTLSLRNTDQKHAIVVRSVSYFNGAGKLVREYVKKPLRIDPLASTEFFVSENDTSGGVSASFLVDWVSDEAVSAPLVESVMIGTASTQGISFICPGRVIADRSRPDDPGQAD